MIAPVLLSALAGAVAVLPAEGRLGQVLPRPVLARPDEGMPRAVVQAAAGLLGVALWWFVGGAVGLVLGALAAAVAPRLLSRLDDDQGDEPEVAVQLPLALDLLAACLVGGATTAAAVEAVSVAVHGPLGARLARVAAGLAVGSTPAEAWLALGSGPTPAGAAARALARAAEGGASVAPAVVRIADDARRESQARCERAARRAGVLAVGPLGLCFLPAFLLIGVAPAVLGLAGPLLASL